MRIAGSAGEAPPQAKCFCSELFRCDISISPETV
jgi:hypothetical protein